MGLLETSVCDVCGKARNKHNSARCSAIRKERHKNDPKVGWPRSAPMKDLYNLDPNRWTLAKVR